MTAVGSKFAKNMQMFPKLFERFLLFVCGYTANPCLNAQDKMGFPHLLKQWDFKRMVGHVATNPCCPGSTRAHPGAPRTNRVAPRNY